MSIMSMGFRTSMRSVVCTQLLMAVVADALPQPAAPSSPSSPAVQSDGGCCCLGTVDERLTRIERQLNDIQKAIASLDDPYIYGHCTVELASYGYDDTTKHGYVKTSGGSLDDIYLKTPVKTDATRGVSLFELDPASCTTRNRQIFDTYVSAEDRTQLLETLEAATTGTIIVGVTTDTAESFDNLAFQNAVGSFFYKYNMDVSGLKLREKFAFIMKKGHPKKTLFQRKPRFGDCLQMKILLAGSTVSDVTFKLLS